MSQLAVLTLAGNYIPHLPVSFVKLKSITAIWLSNNQTKPLVQLNTDFDPQSGLKVLTNFLLPQQVRAYSFQPLQSLTLSELSLTRTGLETITRTRAASTPPSGRRSGARGPWSSGPERRLSTMTRPATSGGPPHPFPRR